MISLVFVLTVIMIWWNIVQTRTEWYHRQLALLDGDTSFTQLVQDAVGQTLPDIQPDGGFVFPIETVLVGNRSVILTHPNYYLLSDLESTWSMFYEALRVLDSDYTKALVVLPVNEVVEEGVAANQPLLVAVEMEIETLNEESTNLLANMIAFFLPSFVGMLGFMLWYQRHIVNHIHTMREHIRKFAANPKRPFYNVFISDDQTAVSELHRELIDLQKGLQLSLLENKRLANLGESLNKVNHDIRNMMSSTILHAEVLQAKGTDDPKYDERIRVIMRSMRQSIAMCDQILEYVRTDGKARGKDEELSLHDVLDDVTAELSADAFGKATLVNQLDPKTVVVGRKQDFYRIFVNILRNAIQAGATNVTVDQTIINEDLAIDMTDNGPGLPPKAIEKLFVPFQGGVRGGGSGLGLPIAYEMASNLGANLRLVTTNASGTTFRVRFPLSKVVPPPPRT
ncbi:MAG: HAMP domain-containing histidine kinase [Alphaproteobacteria bacterium]|nr:HAMP domain-containing histidine kinase [Alphaproteobacteria bacterium]